MLLLIDSFRKHLLIVKHFNCSHLYNPCIFYKMVVFLILPYFLAW